jgi:hypothetical protein
MRNDMHEIYRLEDQGIASSSGDGRFHLCRAESGVGVRHSRQAAFWSSVAALAKTVVFDHREAFIGGIQWLLDALKHVALDQQLGSETSIDAVGDILVIVVENVSGAEAERWGT